MNRNMSRELNYFILKHRMLLFLVGLLVMLIIFPIIHERASEYFVLMELAFTGLLIMGIYIVTENRRVLTVAILIALLAFVVIGFNFYINSARLLLTGMVLEVTFFVITTVTIISHVLEYKKVSADKIYGAMSGYLLMGVTWALLYIAIEAAYPASFSMLNTSFVEAYASTSHRYYFANFIYFSFVTQSTLGYGDLVPVSALPRVLSSLQALSGQLYVAVLIARLVGLHIGHTHMVDKGPSNK